MIIVYPNSYFLPVIREVEDRGLVKYRNTKTEIPKELQGFNEIKDKNYKDIFDEVDEEFVRKSVTD